jgi:iron complex transport system substrate-binding protein
MRVAILVLLLSVLILCLGSMPAICTDKTITDMEGRTVTMSEPIERVVTAGQSMSPCVIAALGVGDKIVGTGGALSASTNETTPTFVLPAIKALPDLGRGYKFNLEAAAALDPDVIILEKDCAGQGDSSAEYMKLIEKFSLFNKTIPFVVINNAACFDKPSPESVYEEITILGELFNKQNKSREVVDLLKEEVALIEERIKDVKPEDRPSVLFLGMVAGTEYGKGKLAIILPDYDCGTIFPEITNVKNTHTGNARELMSSEQLLTMDPDVIILVRSPGGYEVEKLYNSADYKALQGMRAVKEKKVFSTGQFELSRNMAGLEFPIEMLIEAKAAYPDRFKDVSVGDLLSNHYKKLYGLNDEQVKVLKEIMGLDWMDKEGF